MSKINEVENYVFEFIKESFFINEDSLYRPHPTFYNEDKYGDTDFYKTYVIIQNKETFPLLIKKIRELHLEDIKSLVEITDEDYFYDNQNYSEEFNYMDLTTHLDFNEEITLSLNFKNIQERENVKTIEIHAEFKLSKEHLRSDKINEILE